MSQHIGFSPSSFPIHVGDTVVWYQADNHHTVTPDTVTTGWGSGSSTLSHGQTYSHTFNVAGTYHYHCMIHPTMMGTITVNP